jgi:hypothetical protein
VQKINLPFVQSTFKIDVWLEMPLAEAHTHFALHRVALQAEHGGTTVRCGRDNLQNFAGHSFESRLPHHRPASPRAERRLRRPESERHSG